MKEARAQARKAAADAENQKLWLEYCRKRDEAKARHESNRRAGRMSPRDLWYFVEGWREKFRAFKCPEYQRAGDLRKWLTRAIDRVNGVLAL